MRLSSAGQTHEVRLRRDGEAVALLLDGQEALSGRVHEEEGCGWLARDGRVVAFYACRVGDAVQVWLEGRVHVFEAAAEGGGRARARSAGPAGDDVAAPMPGIVRDIHVQVGDVVEERQALAVMESMKMQLTLAAPRAGRVARVACAVGDLVEMGAILITLEKMGTDDIIFFHKPEAMRL